MLCFNQPVIVEKIKVYQEVKSCLGGQWVVEQSCDRAPDVEPIETK